MFNLGDSVKMASLNELSTVKFIPKLNLKSGKQSHLASENLQQGKPVDPYYINVAEELSGFDQWCISELNEWGIPIP